MKKIIFSTVFALAFNASAEYTAHDKLTKVIIPQPPSSGIGSFYRHLESYASKNNIAMIPVYKPGAEGKIGIDHARENNDRNSILLALVSDITEHNAKHSFIPVTSLIDASVVLVTSKKSNIKTLDELINHIRHNSGKLTWGIMNNGHKTLIYHFSNVNGIKQTNIISVPYGKTGPALNLISGDLDVSFLTPASAKQLLSGGFVNKIDLDKKTKELFDSKMNTVGLFLQKNASKEEITFWSNFIKKFFDDERQRLEAADFSLSPQGQELLITKLEQWVK